MSSKINSSKSRPEGLRLQTLAVRAAVERSQYGENSEALYLTSGYVQPSAEISARRFAGEEEGYTYGRSGNPTVSSMEQRLAALEGTEACMATSSGMSAIMLMCFSLLKAGDHVVFSQSMFGSTIKLIGTEFARFGVESTAVPQTDLAAWKAAIRPNTRLLFAETPTNPLTEVCDIAALAEMAHNAGALLAVDNCFATPALQRPVDMGADIVMHSGTKYLDGQGRVMAGALCASEKLVLEKFLPVQKNSGMVLSPFNAWVVLKGLETLDLRVRRQTETAAALADLIAASPKVSSVRYPGREDHPQALIARKQMSGFSNLLAFDLGSREAAWRFLDALEIVDISNNLGDAKSMATHPSTTTHRAMPEEKRLEIGLTEGFVRMSVGLEDLRDLTRDISRALDAA